MLKRSKNVLLKQASEQHIGTDRDGVTDAPVIELGYKLIAVPEKVNMVTY